MTVMAKMMQILEKMITSIGQVGLLKKAQIDESISMSSLWLKQVDGQQRIKFQISLCLIELGKTIDKSCNYSRETKCGLTLGFRSVSAGQPQMRPKEKWYTKTDSSLFDKQILNLKFLSKYG